jgi:hypothetical protein
MCGSEMFIPYPGSRFFHPLSQICTELTKNLTQKISHSREAREGKEGGQGHASNSDPQRVQLQVPLLTFISCRLD